MRGGFPSADPGMEREVRSGREEDEWRSDPCQIAVRGSAWVPGRGGGRTEWDDMCRKQSQRFEAGRARSWGREAGREEGIETVVYSSEMQSGQKLSRWSRLTMLRSHRKTSESVRAVRGQEEVVGGCLGVNNIAHESTNSLITRP